MQEESWSAGGFAALLALPGFALSWPCSPERFAALPVPAAHPELRVPVPEAPDFYITKAVTKSIVG